LDPGDHSRGEKTTTPPLLGLGKLVFPCWHHKEYCFTPMWFSIEYFVFHGLLP
jgi:hypothetical protein